MKFVTEHAAKSYELQIRHTSLPSNGVIIVLISLAAAALVHIISPRFGVRTH